MCPLRTTATGILYQFNTVFSASGSVTNPAAPGPWIDASFEDSSDGVVLTVTNLGLTGTEFVSGLYFNLDPAYSPTNLSFSLVSQTSGVTSPTIQTGTDGFKADGDGKYDVLLGFSTSGGRFGAGDYITYLITGISGLTATNFAFLSEPAGGSGPFYAAGHIQGIGDGSMGNSVWVEPSAGPIPIPIPEPTPVAIVTIALGLWGASRLWLRRRTA